MSVYLVEGKGWRYDFTLKGTRHTEAWFKTKREATQAEAKRREEIKKPKTVQSSTETDMVFLDLVNKRLDHVLVYNSKTHYASYTYLAKRWVNEWGELMCSEITREMVQSHMLERKKFQVTRQTRTCAIFAPPLILASKTSSSQIIPQKE